MELRQLKYFVAIVEAGSFSRAAQALHVAQPALSAQIARLEEEFGVKLLVRSVRGVVATEPGMAVLNQARLVLRQIDATPDLARQAFAGPSGHVAVGLPWTVRSVLGLSLLRRVRSELPSVTLEIIEGPSAVLASMLAQGKLQLAIVFDNTPDESLLLAPLLTESLRLVGARGSLEKRTDMTLDEVAELPLLLLSRPNGIREEIERQALARGKRLKIVAEINSPALLIDAVRDGLGYSVLPACGIESALRDGQLDTVTLEAGRLQRCVHIGTAKVFALSLAAERIAACLEELTNQAIVRGEWEAHSLRDPAPA